MEFPSVLCHVGHPAIPLPGTVSLPRPIPSPTALAPYPNEQSTTIIVARQSLSFSTILSFPVFRVLSLLLSASYVLYSFLYIPFLLFVYRSRPTQ